MTINNLNQDLKMINDTLNNKDLWITVDKDNNLQSVKKSGRVIRILSSLLRVLGIDVYSHVRINNVANAVLLKAQKEGVSEETRDQTISIMNRLNNQAKGKYQNTINEKLRVLKGIGPIMPPRDEETLEPPAPVTLNETPKPDVSLNLIKDNKFAKRLEEQRRKAEGSPSIPPRNQPKPTQQDLGVPPPAIPPRS